MFFKKEKKQKEKKLSNSLHNSGTSIVRLCFKRKQTHNWYKQIYQFCQNELCFCFSQETFFFSCFHISSNIPQHLETGNYGKAAVFPFNLARSSWYLNITHNIKMSTKISKVFFCHFHTFQDCLPYHPITQITWFSHLTWMSVWTSALKNTTPGINATKNQLEETFLSGCYFLCAKCWHK